MKKTNLENLQLELAKLGIKEVGEIKYNLPYVDLIEESIKSGEGVLNDTGALVCYTGEFTGRSPKDRFIVKDEITQDEVWWGNINIPFDTEKFEALRQKMASFLDTKTLYIRETAAGANPEHQLNLRIIGTQSWHSLFCYNMFLRLPEEATIDFMADYTVLVAPDFEADPEVDGTRSTNFSIINFSEKLILVGGTGYTGETKKGVFSVLNFLLPQQDILPMHCSANKGKNGDTAVFFGLSGTGKTTLSTDPDRLLIGDDEHGWTDEGIYNFEGGCYAKVIDLSQDREADIWNAIRFGAMVENIKFYPDSRKINFADDSITQNTRVSYPIHFIKNAVEPSVGGIPTNIFFLTCDAFGVLPPISKLTVGQAMYHFISGYTAKIAGTEEGVNEPQPAFSACFGAPFMPLHPTKYATLLGEKMQKYDVNVWLVNTGWSGGSYGKGSRMKLKYTRAMITAALENNLAQVDYEMHPVFGLQMPLTCAGVPEEILIPRKTWGDVDAYDQKADFLADLFHKNFKQFRNYADEEILGGGPLKSIVS